MYTVLHVRIHTVYIRIDIRREECKGGAATTSSLIFLVFILSNCFIFVLEVVKVREHKLLFDAATILYGASVDDKIF